MPNWTGTGGISLIDTAGQTHHILANCTKTLRPNGIALETGGSILLAHMGDESGGIYRLYPSGDCEEVVTTIESECMPPANFVVQDSQQRIWITVSTRKTPRAADYRADARSGFIAVAEPGSTDARIVADNLGYTNECVIDETNGKVFVNETFGRRLSQFNLNATGPATLGTPSTLCQFGAGTYPDGLALDEEGFLWVTSIISNRILRIAPDGSAKTIFEDSVQSHLDWTESAYQSNELGRQHLDQACAKSMKNISNLAFAGKDRNRLYLGNLLGDSLPWIDTQYTGVEMPHWNASLGELERYV
ncbi:MAG: SMP-30/gluconolactonase/LRE family protein [Granulosicoccus sp.]